MLTFLVLAWLFCMGACVGSFLNVVVYRLPANKSVISPGSHCPKCGKPIRWYDNVPIASWFVLGGRCRDCGTAFSLRYALVEGVAALLFAGLAAVEILSDGANLPLAPYAPPAAYDVSALSRIYVYHLALLSTLLCVALIEIDGHPLPLSLVAAAAFVGLFAPPIWPELRPVTAWGAGTAWLDLGRAMRPWVDGVAGLAVGAAVGAVAWPITRRGPSAEHGGRTAVLAAALVGLFLGWQAAVGTVVLATAARLAASVLRPLKGLGWAAWLWVFAILWIVFWKNVAGVLAGLVQGGRP
jgi:leader peptidase (prepilin peptidase)/N-methyltransferase